MKRFGLIVSNYFCLINLLLYLTGETFKMCCDGIGKHCLIYYIDRY